NAIAERFVPGETVTLSTNSGFGARIAQDKLGVPHVTTHFAPCYIPSIRRPPRFAWWRPPDWAPTWVQSLYFWIGDRTVIDPLLPPGTHRLRSGLRLAPVRRVPTVWKQAAGLVLALVPRRFRPPRPEDWAAPPGTAHFPAFHQGPGRAPPPEVEKFL